MGIYLNSGNDAFKISVNDDIYVDKSGLISLTNRRIGKRKRYLCVSRPRRFGKSMAAEMLAAYYSRGCDSAGLFQGSEIERDSSYAKNLNQYDVFSLNIQQFLWAADTPAELVPVIEERLLKEVQQMYGSFLDGSEKNLSHALACVYAKETRPDKGFLFILDEWDCIFREAKEDVPAQKRYLDFLKDLFKDRTYVKLVYMTGILPVKKYGTHSALNIFDEFSMTDPDAFARFTGFTEQDVQKLCGQYGKNFEEAKLWYDGYCFPEDLHIYNPKSIVDAMLGRRFKSYWVNTETYEALKIYIEMNFDGLKDAVITMLGGIAYSIDTGTFQNDMTSLAGKDDVLTLLVHLGYLAYKEETQEVFIPNEEVRTEFVRAVKNSGWKEIAQAISASEKLLDATLQLNAEAVAKGVDAVHSDSTSILSYHDENSLSCVITLAYYSAKKDYQLIREFPTGKGFADIVFLPFKASAKPAIVVELKWDRSALGAVAQIKERNYVSALRNYKGNILLVGINYDKKTKMHDCVIEAVYLS